MVLETPKLGVDEAKEIGEDIKGPGPSGESLYAFDRGHSGNVHGAHASCQISTIHNSLSNDKDATPDITTFNRQIVNKFGVCINLFPMHTA